MAQLYNTVELYDKHLLTRLEKQCHGFKAMDPETKQLNPVFSAVHVALQERLENVGSIEEEMGKANKAMLKIRGKRLALFANFSMEIAGIFKLFERVWDALSDDTGKPNRKKYMEDFFEATEVFKGKHELGLPDRARRGNSTIYEWVRAYKYQECIEYLLENTPEPMSDDRYKLVRDKGLCATTYKEAGGWCFQKLEPLKSSIGRGDPINVLEYLYEKEKDNRNMLEGLMKAKDKNVKVKFPFHTVIVLTPMSDEDEKEIYDAHRESKKNAAIFGKQKVDEETAKKMADLKKRVKELENENERLLQRLNEVEAENEKLRSQSNHNFVDLTGDSLNESDEAQDGSEHPSDQDVMQELPTQGRPSKKRKMT